MTDLQSIFGPEATGSSPEEMARSSKAVFVRSHMQLAQDSESATGRRLTAYEAFRTFGLETLTQVAENGGVGLISNASEAASEIADRRKTLRLSKRSLASAAGVAVDDVTAAETAGEVLPIRTIEKIYQALALDERAAGIPGARGDNALVTRLREMSEAGQRDEGLISSLTEAAWVIARQAELSNLLNADKGLKAKFLNKSPDYGDNIWSKGYELAERTRRQLGLDAQAPITSIYTVCQDELGIPVVELDFENNVAGATVMNGDARGIVIGTNGVNRSVLVKRMTIAHELGHHLWDPRDQLERVRVDVDADLNRRDIRDKVEARANAFAVAFLAPRAAVRRIDTEEQDDQAKISRLVEEYGISPMAAADHLMNICGHGDAFKGRPRSAPANVIKTWAANEKQENLITGHVPRSRGGRFALLTIQAARRKLITLDTAAAWLKLDRRLLQGLF
jgi:Zn-dependent peptidase ImmA (M78 family)